MPELPEVEFTARQLRSSMLGATINEARVFWERTIGHPHVRDFCELVAGQHLLDIRKRGKLLLFELSNHLLITIHRRMTGNLLLLSRDWQINTALQLQDPVLWNTRGPSFVYTGFLDPGDARQVKLINDLEIASDYCRVYFSLADGRQLLYTDPRKFGRIELWPQEKQAGLLAGLGPEPLSSEFTLEVLQQALSKRKLAIKQVLLDQQVIAGVGNIYADEALYYAQIHPLRQADSLTEREVRLLHEGIIAVLLLGIEHGGTSFNDYRDLWGAAGQNYNHVQVYKQVGKPCRRCGMLIERMVVAQRGTHYCPGCQLIAYSVEQPAIVE